MSDSKESDVRLKRIILEAAREATNGNMDSSPEIDASAARLADSTSAFLDTLSGSFSPTVGRRVQEQRLASGLFVAFRRSALESQISDSIPNTQMVNVLREPLNLHVLNGDRPTQILPFDDQQRVMLAHFTAATLTDLNHHIYPWVSRQRIENSSNGAFTLNELRRNLFDPLQEAGIVESSNDGFLLNASLRAVRTALITPDEALIRVVPFDKWQNDEFGKVLIPAALAPTVKVLSQLADQRSGDERILMEQLSEITGKKIDAIKRDIRMLKGLNLLAAGIRSKGTRAADVAGYIHTISRNMDKPQVGVQEVHRQQFDQPDPLNEVSTSSEITSKQQIEKKKFTKPDEILLLEFGKRKQIFVTIASKGLDPKKMHRPSAIINNGGRLNAVDNSGKLVWDQLISLGLSVKIGRDHHKELTPIGALVATLFPYPEISQRASAIGNGKKGAVEVVALHLAHQLKAIQDKRVHISCSEADRVKLERFISGSQEVLRDRNLSCYCPDCTKKEQPTGY